MKRMVALIVLLAGAASAEEPRPYDFALLLASEALIAADCLQSMDIKNHVNWNYRDPPGEADPLVSMIIGKHPTDTAFIAVGVTAGLTTAVLWYNLPERWRWIAPSLVGLVEAGVVAHNASIGLRIRI
jgi:hypothetical protein